MTESIVPLSFNSTLMLISRDGATVHCKNSKLKTKAISTTKSLFSVNHCWKHFEFSMFTYIWNMCKGVNMN